MDEWGPGVRAELAAFVPQINHLQPLESVDVEERCTWKVSVENYSECYHCSLNHLTDCQDLDAMTYEIDMTQPHAGDYRSFFLWTMFSFQVYPGQPPEHLSLAHRQRRRLRP